MCYTLRSDLVVVMCAQIFIGVVPFPCQPIRIRGGISLVANISHKGRKYKKFKYPYKVLCEWITNRKKWQIKHGIHLNLEGKSDHHSNIIMIFFPTNHFLQMLWPGPWILQVNPRKVCMVWRYWKGAENLLFKLDTVDHHLVSIIYKRSATMIHDLTNIKTSLERSSTSHRLVVSDSDTTLDHLDKDHALIIPESNASVMLEKGSSQVCTVHVESVVWKKCFKDTKCVIVSIRQCLCFRETHILLMLKLAIFFK